jgi:predicted metalloprotease
MGRVTGDKSRYNKMRQKKLARRINMRSLRKELQAKADAGAAAPTARPA